MLSPDDSQEQEACQYQGGGTVLRGTDPALTSVGNDFRRRVAEYSDAPLWFLILKQSLLCNNQIMRLSKNKVGLIKIIFLDIDGTLIGLDQKPNAKTLAPLIYKLSKRGILFGLNSNRALEDVLPIIKTFNLTGPFVLENGAYALSKVSGKKIISKDLPAGIIEKSKSALVGAIGNKFPESKIVYADTVGLIKKNKWAKGLYFYANKNRHFSASIHNRLDGKPNHRVAQALARELNLLLKGSGLFARVNTHGETVTIEAKNTNKSTGINLIQKLYPKSEIIAIGDGEGDLELRHNVDKLYAVGDAIPELKKVADGVAKKDLTQGVVEILEKFLQPS